MRSICSNNLKSIFLALFLALGLMFIWAPTYYDYEKNESPASSDTAKMQATQQYHTSWNENGFVGVGF